MAAIDVVDRPTDVAERQRLDTATSLESSRQAKLGQFFTPSAPAQLIASMLTVVGTRQVRLLDPGAGVGSLTAAAVEHFAALGIDKLEVVAWEIDEQLHPVLSVTLEHCCIWAADRGLQMSWQLRDGDYIEATAAALAGELGTESEQFNAIITNPPYRKVNGGTPERHALERVGLPITNLYTAFLALAATQLDPGGVLAAITPRSFASGRYYAPFRRFFFDRLGIERLHLFESRANVFADAGVLQENVIFSARQGSHPQKVQLSFSHGINDAPRTREVPLSEVIKPNDPQYFLRIPGEDEDTAVAETIAALPATLDDLGIAVSTGKVVEFRAKSFLRLLPEAGAAALIRPNHLKDGKIRWPATNGQKKPNALAIHPASEKLLLPNETYVVVKRLTAKEESRRVRAAISAPSVVPGQCVAFENHLNVFHRCGRGLQDHLAQGLSAYLNSSLVDRYIRQFNGHTQINATDLRHLRYPNTEQLCALGIAVQRCQLTTEEEIDDAVGAILGQDPSQEAA